MLAARMSRFIGWMTRNLIHEPGRDDSEVHDLNAPEGTPYEDALLDHDLNYEDALLDAEMRVFFRNEYGGIEPPSGVFPQVLNAIKRHDEERAVSSRSTIAAQLQQLMVGLRGISVRPGTARIFS